MTNRNPYNICTLTLIVDDATDLAAVKIYDEYRFMRSIQHSRRSADCEKSNRMRRSPLIYFPHDVVHGEHRMLYVAYWRTSYFEIELTLVGGLWVDETESAPDYCVCALFELQSQTEFHELR